MTDTYITIILLFSIMSLYIIFNVLPIKFAIKESKLNKKEYIICEVVRTTGFDWRVKRSTYGYEGLIKFEGIIPVEKYGFGIMYGANEYAVYGEFVSDVILDTEHGVNFRIFKVTNWDILYPIKRNDIFNFILSKSYLCRYDIN